MTMAELVECGRAEQAQRHPLGSRTLLVEGHQKRWMLGMVRGTSRRLWEVQSPASSEAKDSHGSPLVLGAGERPHSRWHDLASRLRQPALCAAVTSAAWYACRQRRRQGPEGPRGRRQPSRSYAFDSSGRRDIARAICSWRATDRPRTRIRHIGVEPQRDRPRAEMEISRRSYFSEARVVRAARRGQDTDSRGAVPLEAAEQWGQADPYTVELAQRAGKRSARL